MIITLIILIYLKRIYNHRIIARCTITREKEETQIVHAFVFKLHYLFSSQRMRERRINQHKSAQ